MKQERRFAIEIAGLKKSFGTLEVLDGIDLEVEPGHVFGYIGPNGAGKSTTIKILCGMLAQTAGAVRVAGIDVAEDPEEVKRRIGYLPENPALYKALTATEHLMLVGRLQGMSDGLCYERALTLLEAFELRTRRNARIGSLSKGMQQKLMIIAALLHDPEILFMDEPLSGLDVHSTVMIKELVRALADDGRTVFYCSHMMDVVERVCDRIVIINKGRIVADGSFEELAAASRDGGTLEQMFLELTGGGDAGVRAQAVVEALRGGNGDDRGA